MAQAGYESCSGCGRLFSAESKDEMDLLLSHDCDDDDE
jgi:hypothetical protein